MKTFVILAVSIILVSILFCPMVLAAPSIPSDVQIVQPDPSLPKELSAFFGKWQGSDSFMEYFLIVEKIDEEKASVYLWHSEYHGNPGGWMRYDAKVSKERGKYIVWFSGTWGINELKLKGEYLDYQYSRSMQPRLRRVP